METPSTTNTNTESLSEWQADFLSFAIDQGVLGFGEFTLKSGRVSPYFFNAGKFQTGEALDRLGRYYAQALIDSGLEFDLLFGPAYKGIPLGTTTVVALNRDHHRSVPFTFNRKEAKDHGEGGELVGAPLNGRVVIVDDVITAGTAIREVQAILEQYPGAHLAGVVVAMDREEKAPNSELSAIGQLRAEFGIPIVPVIRFSQLVAFLQARPEYRQHLPAIEAYRSQYGVNGGV
ncbi:MAG: orotate phosphoribosyltransferase [Saccharospirillum sp.]